MSVAGRVFGREDEIALEDVVDRIKAWPLRWPRKARPPALTRAHALRTLNKPVAIWEIYP